MHRATLATEQESGAEEDLRVHGGQMIGKRWKRQS